MNIIVCVDENFNIGCNNSLLFNIKEDMQFFKQKTINNVVIMGRKTLQSLPNSSPLKNRVNFVLTRNEIYEGCMCVIDIDMLFDRLQDFKDKEIFVIGGEQVYNLLLPYCDKAYVTKVFTSKVADTKFPNLDNLSNWKLIDNSEIFYSDGLNFAFTLYQNLQKKSIFNS